ncbi:Uncharacterized protein TCAP_07598 [Tolypocladium capitatum]|uniref:Uncharacterized protein n=1 Tax=Tolypocladium capitatum TaxID=45235 RepID=A0A2K3PSA6_9HYPO|nr:Uncharacterized protein TCAP_07598 [Tolypocladium capitatum]
MAARAPWKLGPWKPRPRLCPLPFAPRAPWKPRPTPCSLPRSASTARPGGTPRPPGSIRRFVPEDVKRFVAADGRLMTTRENKEFLLAHDLEPDNGRMTRFTAGPDLHRLAADFNATFAFSPRHVVHPHDLRYFEPRGHPLAAMKRAEYARKTRQQPLWIMVTSVGGPSAVVRTLTRRRLASAIHGALEAMGYRSAPGSAPGKEIRGTIWVTIHDPVKAASQSAERFGTVVAAALDRQCSQRR